MYYEQTQSKVTQKQSVLGQMGDEDLPDQQVSKSDTVPSAVATVGAPSVRLGWYAPHLGRAARTRKASPCKAGSKVRDVLQDSCAPPGTEYPLLDFVLNFMCRLVYVSLLVQLL